MLFLLFPPFLLFLFRSHIFSYFKLLRCISSFINSKQSLSFWLSSDIAPSKYKSIAARITRPICSSGKSFNITNLSENNIIAGGFFSLIVQPLTNTFQSKEFPSFSNFLHRLSALAVQSFKKQRIIDHCLFADFQARNFALLFHNANCVFAQYARCGNLPNCQISIIFHFYPFSALAKYNGMSYTMTKAIFCWFQIVVFPNATSCRS